MCLKVCYACLTCSVVVVSVAVAVIFLAFTLSFSRTFWYARFTNFVYHTICQKLLGVLFFLIGVTAAFAVYFVCSVMDRTFFKAYFVNYAPSFHCIYATFRTTTNETTLPVKFIKS